MTALFVILVWLFGPGLLWVGCCTWARRSDRPRNELTDFERWERQLCGWYK